MINSVLLEVANQTSSKPLKKGRLSNKSSHLEKNGEKKGIKFNSKEQQMVSSSEESSEEEVVVDIKKEIIQSSDEDESINELSDSVDEHHNSHIDNLTVSGVQKKSKTKKNNLQNYVSENNEKTIESIEKRILEQTHSDVGFGTSANGTLNILQNISLSPPKIRNPREQFSKLYPNIKQLLVELPTKFSNKYDYHLFRLPKNIDPQSLLNMEINIQEENKIICGDKKFIIKPTTKIPSPGLIVPENIILNFKSNIVMEKYVKSKKYPKLEHIEKKPISLPNDLKNRHPLFGSNFEEKIELDEDIKRKLDAAISNTLHSEKKSKKKKVKQEDQSQGEEVIFNLLNNLCERNGTPGKKKDANISLSQDSISGGKKVKTKKCMIDETLRNLKSELLSEYETDPGDVSFKKKKHKKHKANKDTSILETPSFQNTVTSEIWSTGLSKKERRMSIANSTLMMDITRQPKFDPNMSDISTNKNKEHSKKNKKRKSNGDDAEQHKKKHKREEPQ